MQQLMILLVISSSSTCFGRLYAHRQEVRLRKDARNMLRNYWLPIKSLIVASSWSHLYLLIKDARSFEYKNCYCCISLVSILPYLQFLLNCVENFIFETTECAWIKLVFGSTLKRAQ